MKSLKNSWQLAKESFKFVWLNKQLLILAILSLIVLGLYFAFIIALFILGATPLFVAALIFLTPIIGNYFNVAIMKCAYDKINGKNLSIYEGLSFANKNLSKIVVWSLFSLTIGLALKLFFRNKSKLFGEIFDVSFSFLTFFAFPIMIFEKDSLKNALRKSFLLIKSKWKNLIAASFSFGLLTFVFIILGFFIFILFPPVSFFVAIFYLLFIILSIAVAKSVLTVALYLYARKGKLIGFDKSMIEALIS